MVAVVEVGPHDDTGVGLAAIEAALEIDVLKFKTTLQAVRDGLRD
jgi:isopropylmalate/homocitrate/citramalate synthase